jgi:hypothetical protein
VKISKNLAKELKKEIRGTHRPKPGRQAVSRPASLPSSILSRRVSYKSQAAGNKAYIRALSTPVLIKAALRVLLFRRSCEGMEGKGVEE